MKKLSIRTCIFFILPVLLLACDNSQQPRYQYYHPKPSLIFTSNSLTTGLTNNPAHGQPGHRCDLPDGAPLPSSAPVPTAPVATALPSATPSGSSAASSRVPVNVTPSVSTALNPAHGQPGHRCDIAVGAPLNSPPPDSANTNKQVVNQTNSSIPAKPPKLNPTHGQPFHRCDIAVGAPLNSAPPATSGTTKASSTPTVTNTIATADSAQIQTAFAADSNTTNGTTGRLNPAHGQPGHDCTIAVGKPLKQ